MEIRINSLQKEPNNRSSQNHWPQLLDDQEVMAIWPNEQAALNTLFNALMSPGDRFLVISGATLTINSKFRWILNQYTGKYVTVNFLTPNFAAIEATVKAFCPRVIVYDLLSIAAWPQWPYLRHLARLSGSTLVLSLGEAIWEDLAQKGQGQFEVDFMTANWGQGLIVAPANTLPLIKASRQELLGKKVLVQNHWVDPQIAVANLSQLLQALDPHLIYGVKGSYALLGFKEAVPRVEDFQQVLAQIGLCLPKVAINDSELTFLELSSFLLTQQKYPSSVFNQLGKIIMAAFYHQKNIIKLEELHQQVLNIYRDHLKSQ